MRGLPVLDVLTFVLAAVAVIVALQYVADRTGLPAAALLTVDQARHGQQRGGRQAGPVGHVLERDDDGHGGQDERQHIQHGQPPHRSELKILSYRTGRVRASPTAPRRPERWRGTSHQPRPPPTSPARLPPAVPRTHAGWLAHPAQTTHWRLSTSLDYRVSRRNCNSLALSKLILLCYY